MARPAAKPMDPLIAALLAKLPATGEEFPRAHREAWLKLMMGAFDFAYGKVEPITLRTATMGDFLDGKAVAPDPGVVVEPAAQRANGHAAASTYDFYVDNLSCVRRDPGGVHVNPDDIPPDALIYDHRTGSARDRSTIVWADGSVGAGPGMNFCGPG